MQVPTILIVDDEVIVASDLATKVTRLGYQVAGTVPTGEAALEVARKTRLDLVLLDVRLDGELDGIETAQRLKALRDIPAIFVTAHSDTTTLRRARESCPYGYLLKPFDEDDLAVQIQLALDLHAAERALFHTTEALRGSEQKFRKAFQWSSVGQAQVEVATRLFIEVNDAFCRMTGYSREELLAMRPDDLTHVDDRASDFHGFARLLRGETPRYGVEKRYVRKDGQTIWVQVEAALIRDQNGTPHQTIAVVLDITDRKQAEAEVKRVEAEREWAEEQARRLSSVRERQQQALADLGVRALQDTEIGRILDEAVRMVSEMLNVELCKILELLPDGCHLLLRSGVGWRPGLVGIATVPMGSESQAGFAISVNEPVVVYDLTSDGRFTGPALLNDHHVVSGISCLIWGPHHGPWGVLGAHSTNRRSFTNDDIAFLQSVANVLGASIQRRAVEDALRGSEDRLRTLADQLEHLVAERTQELVHSREQLRALASELNLAEQRERKRLATELHDHLQQMLVLGRLKLGQGKKMAESLPALRGLIRESDEVLADALMYTRTLVAELSPPVLRDYGLGPALKWLSEYMKRHDLTVHVEVPEDFDPKLPDDQSILLFQSVRELLINTAKHAGTRAAWVTVSRQDGDGAMVIEVRDEGAGFDPAVVTAAGAPESPGGGLSSKFGLFSIQERMRAIGGSIEIRSMSGKGTTAVLKQPLPRPVRPMTVPVSTADRPSAPAARPSLASLDSRVRVLLVDDHTMVRQGLHSLLEGYKDMLVVGEACDGEEAVSAVPTLRPHVVIMDINMPKKNGIEATADIRRRFPDVAVIGLSVNASGPNQTEMMKAGAAMLLTKDAAVENLHAAITEVLTGMLSRTRARH
ncbi:MAG TPA: response regulator [Nitrospira sp.]|nr:response regulator [Nitrospira sp.]